MAGSFHKIYCAFCRAPRRIYAKRRIGGINFLQAIVLACVCSWVFFHRLDPRALVFVIMFLFLIEAGILLRHRFELPCPYCGFDPVIYKKNPEQACLRVKAFLKEREQDPKVMLSSVQPQLTRKKHSHSTREIVV